MWEPVGPLPAHVYWKRRWLALAAVLGMCVVCGLSVAAFTAPRPEATTDQATTPAANRSTLAPESPTATTGPTLAASPVPAVSPSPTPTQTPSPTPTTVPAPPTGPPPCSNDMILVGAAIDALKHKVGDHPVLSLVVVNVSPQACVRDLDGKLQEIAVWDRAVTTKLWSSNDCANPSAPDFRTLLPGQPVTFTVRWTGLSSSPGCAAPRNPLPAGDYTLLSRVDDRISGPSWFSLTS